MNDGNCEHWQVGVLWTKVRHWMVQHLRFFFSVTCSTWRPPPPPVLSPGGTMMPCCTSTTPGAIGVLAGEEEELWPPRLGLL